MQSNVALDPQHNPLATEKITRLITKFGVPSIISFLVSALYNIVDQIFIGRGVGMLGNAATNVAFPLSTIATSIALLLGIGGASNFNLSMGRGEQDRAGHFAGNSFILLAVCGTALGAVTLCFLHPLMLAFGATEQVMPFAMTYTSITAFGLPLVIFSTGCSHLIRADGSPTFSMACMLSGAILNTILDPLFIFGFNMGIAGGALATVIGQFVSAALCVYYLFHFRSTPLTPERLRPRWQYARSILSLGAASFFNQLAMTAVQITLNNTLTHYGALSVYGSDIPLACVGIITKVNTLLMAFVIGTCQGCQPIFGFNYGAKNYDRVKKTYLTAFRIVMVISVVAFACFQLFPRQIVSIFGSGSEAYFHFAEQYFRIYMLMTFINGLQPLTSTFFTSIGKAQMGIIMSLTRQIVFLLPLIVLFPMLFGIDGVMYAGPIADVAAAVLAVVFVIREFHKMERLEPAQRQSEGRTG